MRVSAREKKFLIGGGAITLAGLILYLGVVMVPSRELLSKEVETKKRALLRQREMVGREDFYRARVEEYKQRLKQDHTRLLPGDNPSIAGAELQRVLKSLADQSGVEVIRRDIQPSQKLQDNLVKVAVRIETNCVPEQLVQFLAAVENYDKFLSVDELAITSFRIQKRWEIRPSVVVAGLIAAVENKSEDKGGGQ